MPNHCNCSQCVYLREHHMTNSGPGRPKIGKQYGFRLTKEEAAYVQLVMIAQNMKAFSHAGRLIIRDAMLHNRLLTPTDPPA